VVTLPILLPRDFAVNVASGIIIIARSVTKVSWGSCKGLTLSTNEEMRERFETSIGYKDVKEFVIAPDDAIEIKLEMEKGSIVKYRWKTQSGGLNYNLHGDGYKGSQESTTYKKGRMTSSDTGEFKAEFDGHHGWFWRNRNNESVTVILETIGDYILIKQMK